MNGVNGYIRRLRDFVHEAFSHTLTSAAQLGVFEEYSAPHTFQPRLTVREAFIASIAALVRIVLGSMTFAVWGVAMWLTWANAPNLALRILFVLPEAFLFFCTMVLLQAGISAAVKHHWPQIR